MAELLAIETGEAISPGVAANILARYIHELVSDNVGFVLDCSGLDRDAEYLQLPQPTFAIHLDMTDADLQLRALDLRLVLPTLELRSQFQDEDEAIGKKDKEETRRSQVSIGSVVTRGGTRTPRTTPRASPRPSSRTSTPRTPRDVSRTPRGTPRSPMNATSGRMQSSQPSENEPELLLWRPQDAEDVFGERLQTYNQGVKNVMAVFSHYNLDNNADRTPDQCVTIDPSFCAFFQYTSTITVDASQPLREVIRTFVSTSTQFINPHVPQPIFTSGLQGDTDNDGRQS